MRLPCVLLGVLAVGASLGCRRTAGTTAAPVPGVAQTEVPDVRCVERPEGCVWCQGRGGPPAFLDAEEPRPLICDPKDDENCVEFCSRLTADCALPWRGGKCLAGSEEEFRRQLFWRDNGERPEAALVGRVVDDAGKRIEGAKVRVWYSGTPISDQVSGKDGLFRVSLRAGPWKYTVRVQSPGLASEIVEASLATEKPGAPPPSPRLYRMAGEVQIRGRIIDEAGAPVSGVVVHALRTPEDFVEVSEVLSGDDGMFTLGGLEAGRRYALRAARFGWTTAHLKVQAPAAGAGPRVTIKMQPTGVIRGSVVDSDGEAEPNATVFALLSAPGAANAFPVRWTADGHGRFAEDRLAPGTYYLWARRGDMLVYPPARLELDQEEGLEKEVKLALSHRGARVTGRIVTREGFALGDDTRVILQHKGSPLAFPRDPVGDVTRDGKFVVNGALPGRYEILVRSGGKAVGITRGPREVEVPIEAGSNVDLTEPIVVRPQLED